MAFPTSTPKSKISLKYKPPRGCKQIVDCEEPDDPYQGSPRRHALLRHQGQCLPWFKCKCTLPQIFCTCKLTLSPSAPNQTTSRTLAKTTVATLQQQCWPKEPIPGSEGCSGSYPITNIVKENCGVLLASKQANHNSQDYQVAIASNGECSMTSSSGFSGTRISSLSSVLRRDRATWMSQGCREGKNCTGSLET